MTKYVVTGDAITNGGGHPHHRPRYNPEQCEPVLNVLQSVTIDVIRSDYPSAKLVRNNTGPFFRSFRLEFEEGEDELIWLMRHGSWGGYNAVVNVNAIMGSTILVKRDRSVRTNSSYPASMLPSFQSFKIDLKFYIMSEVVRTQSGLDHVWYLLDRIDERVSHRPDSWIIGPI